MARGGLLRRGLALNHARAALLTNIAEDHLGEFGIADLQQLADVKWTVCRVLGRDGYAVLNAEDTHLVERAAGHPGPIWWFGRQSDNPVFRPRHGTADACCTIEDGALVAVDAQRRRHRIIDVGDVPLSLGGLAKHNVMNALGAAALMLALGLPIEAVAIGLRINRPEDNPDRGNLYDLNGVHVLLDFAHNPHGLRALFELASAYPARRRILLIGQAGDRSNAAIRELSREAWRIGLHRVVIKEMSRYTRGRAQGEVADLIVDELLANGAVSEQLSRVASEAEGVEAALDRAAPGDLVILLIHEDLARAQEILDSRRSSG